MPKEQEPKDSRAFDTEGLVLPRKLPNPNAESREKKDLHKEMLWKMKYGGNDPKDCELQKAYANMANRQRLKEIEVEKANQMTFEKLLEEQKLRLHSVGVKSAAQQQTQGTGQGTINNTTDHHQDHHEDLQRLAAATIEDLAGVGGGDSSPPNHDEFYRVFSKVRAKTYHGAELVGPNVENSAKAIDQRTTKAI